LTKYLIGIGVLFVIAGYFLLASPRQQEAPVTVPVAISRTPEPSPAVPPPPAPVAIVSQKEAPIAPNEETLLEEMAADVRESLPSALTDTLTMTDAQFLPRMRIMQYDYVIIAANVRASARDMRTLIEGRAETICLEGRVMFGMDVTLRNSFEDSEGNLFQRVYLLPEDCEKFY
jgi:hypothetical protein